VSDKHGSVNGGFGKKENRNFALQDLYFKWEWAKDKKKVRQCTRDNKVRIRRRSDKHLS